MTLLARLLIKAVVLAMLVTACGASATQVNADNPVPTPFTPDAPVFIPTLAPIVPTPSFEPTVVETASESDEEGSDDTASADEASGEESSTEEGNASAADASENAEEADGEDSDDDDAGDAEADEGEPSPTTEPETPTATPTPLAPIPVPTRAPAPQPTARPAAPTPRPIARPTIAPAPFCPGGQVLVSGRCACPAGQAKRPGDSQCVRLCIQSDLTISNSCVCTGQLVDNGGQCVLRCQPGQVTDQFGGCKSA